MDNMQAVLGGGCFWCVEAIYQKLIGVQKVVSGYAGGEKANPTYEEVCTGSTGHAEVAQITFDPSQISYEDLLYVFFRVHNPTTLNAQGGDRGTQYRSIILTHNEEQATSAEKLKRETDELKIWDAPLVTEIKPLEIFYPAEDHHQNYYQENRFQPYCVSVIDPKLQKFYKVFKDKTVS